MTSSSFPITFLIVALIGLVGSIFSQGFYHPDEQFAILELMNYKLGGIAWDQFNWDIHLKMRPFLQSSLYYVISKALGFVGLENPFAVSTFFRLIGYSLGVWSVYLLSVTRELVPIQLRNRVFLFTMLSWFVPFLLFRTSSEAFGCVFFLLGISSLFLLNKGWAYLVTGMLWGLSFYFRFQMGICIASAGLWLLFIKQDGFKYLIILALGFLIISGFATWVDYWGYGEWTYTPWNYLYYNLIEKKVNDFGTSPFWFYIVRPIMKGIPPIGPLLLLGTFLYWWDQPKSMLTWVTIPFFLVHSFIGHKELRFLFFVYLLAPLFTVIVWDRLKLLLRIPYFAKSLLVLGIIVNFFALLKVTLTPAYTPMSFYSYIHNELGDRTLFTPSNEGGNKHLVLQMAYYNPNKKNLIPVKLNEFITQGQKGILLTSTFAEKEKLGNISRCKNLKGQYPEWVLRYNWFKWRDRSAIWNLWDCDE